MAQFDFSPLMRSTIGFDRVANVLNNASRVQATYPPHNVVRVDDDTYRLEMALPGYKLDDIEVVFEPNSLLVRGEHRDAEETNFLHRGITFEPFERRFQLAEHIEVNDARFEQGVLTITLVRNVPDEMRPRVIQIGANPRSKQDNVRKLKAA